MLYVNITENRITSKIKTGYYVELLTPEIVKLLGSPKSKINKDKNGENVPHLEKYWSIINILWHYQQRLSASFECLVYICS